MSKFQLEILWKATVLRNLAIYGVHNHLPVYIWSQILFLQFCLLQGPLEHQCHNVWLFWASVLVDKINQLLPVPHICIQGLGFLGARTISLQFETQLITTKKVVFGNSGRLLLTFLPARAPKSIAGCLFPRLPFFLASRISLAHFFNNIVTRWQQIDSALSKLTNGSQVSKVAEKSATAISPCRGQSRTCFNQFCPRLMDQSFFSKNPATHTFFHLLNALKLGCPILFTNCFNENSICFRLIGGLSSAPPKSNKMLLSPAASYSS